MKLKKVKLPARQSALAGEIARELSPRPSAPRRPASGKPAPKFTTSRTPKGRVVHEYSDGRRVVLPAKPGKPAPRKPTPAPALTTDPYAEAVAAATRTKFQPAQDALASQQRAEQAQGPRIDAWYDRYRGAVAQATSANAAASAQAQASLTGLQNAAATNDRAGQAQISQQMQADAASRGATVDPQVAVQLQQGSQVRAGNLAGSQAVQAGQGVQQGAVDRQRGVAGEGIRVASLLENAGRVRELLGKKTQMARDEGDYKVTAKQDLISAEQKSRLEEIALTGKLATDTLQANKPNEFGYTPAQWSKLTPKQRQNIQRTYKGDLAEATRPPAKPASTTPNQYGYTPKEWGAMTTGQRQAAIFKFKQDSRAPAGRAGAKGKSPYQTLAQQRTALKDLGTAKSVAAELRGKGGNRARARRALLDGIDKPGATVSTIAVPDDPSTPANEEQRVSTRVPGKKREPVDELTVRVALDQTFNPGGLLSPETVDLLRKAGISVGATGARTRRSAGKGRRVVRPNEGGR